MTRYLTVDSRGTARAGPFGAWWAWIRPRACNGIGVSYEVPRWRMWAWNAAFVAGEMAGTLWAHASGVAWVEIGGAYAGTFTAGAGWIFGALPVLAYRDEWRHAADVAHWQADAALVEAEVTRRHLARHGVDISRDAMRAREREPVAA